MLVKFATEKTFHNFRFFCLCPVYVAVGAAHMDINKTGYLNVKKRFKPYLNYFTAMD